MEKAIAGAIAWGLFSWRQKLILPIHAIPVRFVILIPPIQGLTIGRVAVFMVITTNALHCEILKPDGPTPSSGGIPRVGGAQLNHEPLKLSMTYGNKV
jgi:hypothetical protein